MILVAGMLTPGCVLDLHAVLGASKYRALLIDAGGHG